MSRAVVSAVPHFVVVSGKSGVHQHTDSFHHGLKPHRQLDTFEHAQQSESLSTAHPLTPDQFLQLQKQQSEEWLRIYAEQVHAGKMNAAHVFGRNKPIRDAAENKESVLYIINKHGK
jgi:hypothetical protein